MFLQLQGLDRNTALASSFLENNYQQIPNTLVPICQYLQVVGTLDKQILVFSDNVSNHWESLKNKNNLSEA